jgi:hypothetical protein
MVLVRWLGLVLGTVLLAMACAGGSTSSSSSSSGGSGSGCNGPQDCPGGFACRARACVSACPINATVTGCVVGAQCVSGACVNNTSCSETVDCAFDKGQVCDFNTGTCVAASETCTEGEMETLCNNGYLCHVKVCYQSCDGAKGCPSGKTCQANHTCQ